MPASRNPLYGLKNPKVRERHRAANHAADGFGKLHAEMALRPGTQLFYWLGQAARRYREDAGVSREAIAAKIERGREVVDRFERGATRPQELEVLLAAYAACVDLDDPRDIVAQGVRLWYEHGEPPSLSNNNSA